MLRGASCGNTQPAFYTQLFHPRPCVRTDKATVTDCHKKSAKKPEKLGSDSRGHSYVYFTHARKKVKFSLYRRYGNDRHRLSPRKDGSAENETRKKFLDFWERFANDRHRPTSFFSWRGGKKIPHTENGRWYVDTTHAQPYPSKNFRFLGKVCK